MIIPSPQTGPEVNHLMETFITIHGKGPLNKEEINEIINWCDKQETKVLLNSSMEGCFREQEELEKILAGYSIWFEDPDTAAFFKIKWA